MTARRIPAEIIDRALALIQPTPEKKEMCRATISQRGDLLCWLSNELNAIPSPGVLKKELEGLRRDLEKARSAIQKKYSPTCRSMIFNKDLAKEKEFLGELGQLITNAAFYHAALVVPAGANKWDNVKGMAAKYADELLRLFAIHPPTKTSDGAFYNLASLLYEGATGKKDENLEQYCRDLDRIGSGIDVRMPFA